MGNELKEPDMKQGDGLGQCTSPGDMMVNKLESVDINLIVLSTHCMSGIN